MNNLNQRKRSSYNMNTFPSNPAAALLLADIGTELHFVQTDTFLGHCIVNGLHERIPVKEIVRQIGEQIQDNRSAVAGCIGIRLVEKIEKYKMLSV